MPPERLANALADRYRFLRELGRGGMATVYLAEDLKHNRTLAIKVFRPEIAATLGSERFLREIEIAAQLEHPHILTLIDSGEVDGVLYYVMPYVAGESLRTKLVREGKLSIADVVRVLRDVTDGLGEAHRHGLVHRDVKPDNVMMSGNHAVITDFGVAKAVASATGSHNVTTAGVALGTPTYMSPEQATAEPGIDHRTDIYSLGVMAYEVLTGHPPFPGGNVQAVLAALLTADPVPVSELRPDVPPALESLVMGCLAKDRDSRWQSTDEVLQRLEAMATPAAGVAPARLSKGNGRERRRVVRAAAVLVPILVVAGAALVTQRRRVSSMRALASALTTLAQTQRFDDVYDSLLASGTSLDARGMRGVAALAGGMITLVTDPPDAEATLTRIRAPLARIGQGVSVGSVSKGLIVAGNYQVVLAASGFESLQFSLDVGVGDTLLIHRTLVPAAWGTPDMAVVDAGRVVGPLPSTAEGEVPAFLIDRHEVTNEAYMRFVAAGGYADASLWPDSLVLAGHTLPRSLAVASLVDRSGLPGPRTWTGGTYPSDRARYPVTGVSWYEASAFAKWAGKSLPSWQQWWRAALGDLDQPYPWGSDHATLDDRSNFSMLAPVAVDLHPFGVSPYGAYDMAGNVREWLAATSDGAQYTAIGGSWQDPTYTFYNPNVERFAPGFASDAIGFRLVQEIPGSPR